MKGNGSKSGGSHQQPKPKQQNANDQKRRVSDHVDVKGAIQVDLHPDIKETNATQDRKSNSREAKKLFIEGATLLVVAAYTVVATCQWFAMLKSLDQARTQTRLSVRPFVALAEGPNSIQNGPLHIDESGKISMKYAIRAENYSNFPAMNVFSFADLIITDDLNAVNVRERIACKDAVIGKPDIGFVLFQGRDRVLTVLNGIPGLNRVAAMHGDDSRFYHFSAWLTGCIAYRDQFGYLYRTRFIYQMVDLAANPSSGRGHPKDPST